MWRAIAVLVFGVLVMGNAAYADIVPGSTGTSTPTDVTSYGFGVAPPILTLQSNPYEQVQVVPNFSDLSNPTVTGLAGIVSGSKKYNTPNIGALGITSWGDLAILFNANEPGDAALQLNALTLTAYSTNGTIKATFSTAQPYSYTNIAQGQGPAGFLLVIAPGELGAPFNTGWYLGMSADIGCPAGARTCTNANVATGDGPESFTVSSFTHPGGVPEPSTLLLMGTGLVGLAGTIWRRHRK